MKLSDYNLRHNFLVIKPYKFRFSAYYENVVILDPMVIHPTTTASIAALYYRCNYFLEGPRL